MQGEKWPIKLKGFTGLLYPYIVQTNHIERKMQRDAGAERLQSRTSYSRLIYEIWLNCEQQLDLISALIQLSVSNLKVDADV